MPLILSRLVPALILGLFFYVGYLLMTTHHVPESPLQSFENWQRADAPYGIPLDPRHPKQVQHFDPRMHLHSPFEAARIPSAPDFTAAMGSESGALTYNAQSFMVANSVRGGKHTGDDVNGIGGKDTDYGDAVYAVANGLVIYAGTPSPGWGKTIILAHKLPDGRTLHSMYAHLHDIQAGLHTLVGRGEKIATVGSADGRYLAHLHLEIRETDGFSPQAGYSRHPFDRLNPTATIASLSPHPADNLSPSALTQLIAEKYSQDTFPSMDAESALQLQQFLQRSSK